MLPKTVFHEPAPLLRVLREPAQLEHQPTAPPQRSDPWDYSWDAFFPLPGKLPQPRSPYEDQRLGVRAYTYIDEQGQKQYDEIGLTPEDFLDPWPGDKPVGSTDHSDDILRIMLTLLELCEAIWPDCVISTDLKVIFEREDLPNNPCPDVAIIVGIPKANQGAMGSCRLISLGAQIPILFEVVSPKDHKTRENDIIRKVDIYEQAGIPYYVIVDVPKYREQTERKPAMRMLDIVVYQLNDAGTYIQMPKDDQGRVFLPPMNLLIGKTQTDQPGIECVAFFDPVTGDQLEDPIQFVRTAKSQIQNAKAETQKAKRVARKAKKAVKTAREAAKTAEERNRELQRELDELRRRMNKPTSNGGMGS